MNTIFGPSPVLLLLSEHNVTYMLFELQLYHSDSRLSDSNLPAFPHSARLHFLSGLLSTPDPRSHATHRTHPSCTASTLFLQQRDDCVWPRASLFADINLLM